MKRGRIWASALALGFCWSCGEPAEKKSGLEALDPRGQQVAFWYQHTEEREEALKELIEEFNRTNEHGIEVIGEYQGSHDDVYKKMLVRLQGEVLPQLVTAYRYQAQEYYLDGGVVDLKPYMDSPRWGLSARDREDFIQSFLDQDYINGVQVALLPHRSMEILYCNADWAKELGYEGPPQNWARFAEMCRKAKEQPFSRSPDKSRSLGFLMTPDASRLAAMVFSRGGDLASQDGRAYTLNTPAMRESLALLRELISAGAAAVVEDDAQVRRAFATGQVLLVMRSSSGLPLYHADVQQGAGFAWDVAPVPYEGPHPVLNVYGASLAVCRSTPEQQLAAWLFIRWLTEPKQQDEWSGRSHYFPVRRSTARQLAPYFRTAYELIDYGQSEPWVVGYGAVRDLIEDTLAEVLNGADMEEALAQLQQKANSTLFRDE